MVQPARSAVMLYDQKVGSTFCRLAFAAHNIRIESMREGAKEVQIDAAARSDCAWHCDFHVLQLRPLT